MCCIGNEEDAKILECLSLQAEIGLLDLKSCKIYLSGIKSRESSSELSNFIEFEEDDSIGHVKSTIIMLVEEETEIIQKI